jgi:hypothetical protein
VKSPKRALGRTRRSGLAAFASRLRAEANPRGNPILWRELTRSLGSEAFVAEAILAIVAAVFIGYWALADVAGDPEARGYAMLREYDTFVSMSIFALIVPLRTFFAVRTDFGGVVAEDLRLANVAPGIVLRGHMWTTFARIAIWTALLAPIVACAYVLRGVSLVDVHDFVARGVLTALILGRVAAQCGRVSARGGAFRGFFAAFVLFMATIVTGAAMLFLRDFWGFYARSGARSMTTAYGAAAFVLSVAFWVFVLFWVAYALLPPISALLVKPAARDWFRFGFHDDVERVERLPFRSLKRMRALRRHELSLALRKKAEGVAP